MRSRCAPVAVGLDRLLLETLKDVYYAERKILKALSKMARGAESPKLKEAFEKHRDETEGHIERLQCSNAREAGP